MTLPVSLPVVLGAAWGVMLAAPIGRSARRVVTVERANTLGSRSVATSAPSRVWTRLRARVDAGVQHLRAGVVGRVVGSLTARRRAHGDDAAHARELPVVIDLLGVAVGAGCTPYLAVEVAARWSPPAIAVRLDAVLRACALGVSFDVALDDAARATPVLRPLSDALLASNRLGAPVGPVWRGSRRRSAPRCGGTPRPTPGASRSGCSSRSCSWCFRRSCCSPSCPVSPLDSGASERRPARSSLQFSVCE